MKLNTDELINLDIRRINIRKEYKEQMKIKYKNKNQDKKDYVLFPKNLISETNEQLRYGISWLQNGFIVKCGSNVIAVDPSVNFLLRLTESEFDLTDITHIYISHKHLDHSSDADALMDFLLRADADTKIIAPSTVFESKVISDFHSGLKPEFKIRHEAIIIDESSTIKLNDDYEMIFIKLNHSCETYGFKIKNKNNEVVYLSDTSYSTVIKNLDNEELIRVREIKTYIKNAIPYESDKRIKDFISSCNVLITNIDSYIYTKNSKTHLPLLDLVDIVKDSKVKKIFIAHINPMGELTYDEWSKKIAEHTKNITGIETISPDNNGLKEKI